MKIVAEDVTAKLGKQPIREMDHWVFNNDEIPMASPNHRGSGFNRFVFHGLDQYRQAYFQG
jgi:hypothetical protein